MYVTKPKRQLIRLESNIYKSTNIIFLSLKLSSIFKIVTIKKMVYIKFGMIIYVSAARIVIDQISSF